MKKALLVGLFLLLVVFGFGAWLWKLGAPPILAASTARLENIEGVVETRANANERWKLATNGQVAIQGQQIRTGADGSVTLTVSGVSQTRLSTSTELIIDSLLLPQADSVKSQTALTLITGRTWSRIVRILELDSAYSVTTDDVVATVRGTAFETAHIPGKETWLTVYDGTVQAANEKMQKGKAMRAVRGAMEVVSSTVVIPKNIQWVEKNIQEDKQFLKETQEELQRELTKDVSAGMYEKLGRPAERLHMAFADETEKAKLADQYLGRRLAWTKQLQEDGQTVKAEAELLRVKTEMQAWMQQTPVDQQEDLFKRAMVQSSVLYHDEVAPGAASEFLKERVEDLKENLIQNQPQIPLKLDGQPPIQDRPLLIQEKPQLTAPLPPAPIQEKPVIDDKAAQEEQARLLVPQTLLLTSPVKELSSKDQTPLQAVVLYSNGTRKDVTPFATFISSDPSIALLIENTLQANERPGTVRVNASYRENGVSVTDSLSFTINF